MNKWEKIVDWGILLLTLIAMMMGCWLLGSCTHCDLEKEHIPGVSCPPADGSHGPCPFGCEKKMDKLPIWVR
jgi:hypothetical protein